MGWEDSIARGVLSGIGLWVLVQLWVMFGPRRRK